MHANIPGAWERIAHMSGIPGRDNVGFAEPARLVPNNGTVW